MKKRILSTLLAGALAATVVAGSAVSASAKVNENGTYDPAGRDTNTYMFAMPGAWESDYWKTNENIAGIYWWTGSDVPKDNFAHEWPGYAVARVEQDPVAVAGQTPAEIKNLYSTPVPKDTTMIIFNNHINGGMPSEPDFDQKKFDAAKQIVDTPSVYNYIGYDDYQEKGLWITVYDAFCEQFGYPQIKWETDKKEVTKSEKAQIKAIFYPAAKLKDAEKELAIAALGELPEVPVYTAIEDGELDPDDFVMEDFGQYQFNFYVDMDESAGLVQGFDNMVYVCNLDPNTMTISTTIVKEGMPTFSGDFFFYYGNGEYGVYPTKEMCIEKLGITFGEDGKPVAPEGYLIDDYGNVAKMGPGNGDKEGKLMVYGNFTGDYYEKKEPVEIPTADPSTTTIPAAATDATSATSATSDSANSKTNSANGTVATGEFAFAAIIFVVVLAGLGTVYFTRKKYNK